MNTVHEYSTTVLAVLSKALRSKLNDMMNN